MIERHLMIDTETLGTHSRAPIVSVGWCYFDPFAESMTEVVDNNGRFYLNVDEQFKLGRFPQWRTIAWWMAQEEKARQKLVGPSVNVSENYVSKLVRPIYDLRGIWAHGATFDITLIQTLYEDQGEEVPWDFRKIRDTRTLYAIAGCELPHRPMVAHDPKEDAIAQALNVWHCYSQLGVVA